MSMLGVPEPVYATKSTLDKRRSQHSGPECNRDAPWAECLFSAFPTLAPQAPTNPLPFFFVGCRFYQRHPPVLRRQREPESVPLLRHEPHRGPLGLHHLPQVCVPPPQLRSELQIQQRSGEDHDEAPLRSLSAARRPHTEEPFGSDSPTDQHVLQFSSVTQRESSPVTAGVSRTFSHQVDAGGLVKKSFLPGELTLEGMIALTLESQLDGWWKLVWSCVMETSDRINSAWRNTSNQMAPSINKVLQCHRVHASFSAFFFSETLMACCYKYKFCRWVVHIQDEEVS